MLTASNIEKICIVTVFDRHYKEAGKTLFNSIRRHTNCDGIDFKVITSDEEVLNEWGKDNCYFVTDDIKNRYKNVQYSKDLPIERYALSWYRYEIFNMTDYDRVICIDSDCICVQDISYLFSKELNKYDLISVEDHFVSKILPSLYSKLEKNGWNFTNLYKRVSLKQVDIQPAVLVVNKNVINNIWYNELLAYANNTGFTYSIDQGILNDFIYQKNINIKLLSLEWNYQDLYAIRCSELAVVNPIIIHCQESKPFKLVRKNVDVRIQKFYDQWWYEYNYAKSLKTTTRMKGKICITTTFDYNYKHAGQTLLSSIRRHTNCDGIDFKIITNDPKVVAEFGAENCHIITPEIQANYNNVKYITDIPKEQYYSSWYRYEMFNFEGYDRVICIDSDCICIEDISYLFSEELNQYDLISTEDMIVSHMFKQHIPSLEKNYGLNLVGLRRRIAAGQVDIQPALLVANKKIVNNKWYKQLITYANTTNHTYSIDEGILNDFIYLKRLNIKILPMEWNYMDTYGAQILELPKPKKPFIVHCQESKPFKKDKADVNVRIHKWYNKWWEEANHIKYSTIVAIIVWNRFENLKLWINAWNQCIQSNVKLIVVHNLESDNNRYSKLCKDNGIMYIPRENKGFDIGAFQDVCKERLEGFPNDWENLIWITDDCIPMAKDFVEQFLKCLPKIPCYEISQEVKTHVRTTGFLVTKEISKKLVFPKDPIENREDCYQFEHKGFLQVKNMYEQIVSMGKQPVMVNKDLRLSPLWDSGVRWQLKLMGKHEAIFPFIKINVEPIKVDVKLVEAELPIRKPIRWKKMGNGSFLFNNCYIKKNQVFTAFSEDIPKQFRDVIIPLEEIVSEIKKDIPVEPVKSNNEPIIYNVLDELAIKHKSDKSSRYHNYAVKYDKILFPFRESFSSILEIGVSQGQSTKMWTDYFENATIHGADIEKGSKICESYSNRVKFHELDQRDLAQLKNLEQFSPFDFVIDDGNHFWFEQILTFEALFPYVRKGGIYIVEDTTTSYWEEYKNNPISPVEYFKTLVDEVHLKGARGNIPINPPQEFGNWEKGWHRREDCFESVPLFESIQFMNGFIVIYKR
jgi:lipopolysaccharide biosynthesis glycosyltransferase